MSQVGLRALVCAALLVCASAASAQVSITGAIAGTVTDVTKAVLPGANVKLKDEGTNVEKNMVTNDSGAFAFRDLSTGTYQITIAISGFRSAIYNKVVVESGRTTDLRIELAVGGVESNITVEGRSPVLEMTSNVLSSTLTNKEVQELPLAGRNAFTFARLVPGAVQPQGGGTHFNGLPGGTIDPTIDGVNNSSNGFKSGGTSFFGTVPARLGAVEQVTVETAGLGGDDGVTGGVNLKFVTRRGTNRFSSSFFEQYRTEKLNNNSFGNVARGLPENKLRRHDFGGNVGGPIPIRGPFANKLFGFFNYEQEWIPQTSNQEVTVLTEEARQGIFRYTTAAGESRTVNVLQMAGAAGFQSTPDPVMAALLAKQAEARNFAFAEPGGSARVEDLTWQEPQKQFNFYPTFRVDYQVRPNVSFMSSYNRYSQDAQGRRVWPMPGMPINTGTFDSGWWVWSTGTNWTINSSMHNELRYGIQHSGDTNEVARRAEFFNLNGTVNGLAPRFTLPLVDLLVEQAAPVIGKHYITTVTDTLTMLRGDHTFKFGGNFRDTQWRDRSLDGGGGYLGLPRYSIGFATGDPIGNVLSTSTIPGATNNDQTAARQLYALLTGRLTEVRAGATVDPATLQYSDSVFRENWTSAQFAGLFVQDSWRVTPAFTLNYGVRWEMNKAPYNHTGTASFPDDANIFGPSTQLFAPGELNGVQDPVFARGFEATKTDWFNLAPRVGFAWTPRFQDGLMAKIFGRGDDTVFRGGWDITYFDEGTNMFASTAGNNTGQTQTRLLQPGMPGFTAGGLTLQSSLPAFQFSPAAYKEVWSQSEITFVSNLGSMLSDSKTGSVQAWNFGVQRQVAKNTVVEVRYVGNRAKNVWHSYNLNETNIFENGFLDEFKRAQTNLNAFTAANPLCGQTGQVACSFANTGLPGQAGLPIFETAFGPRGAQAALAANQAFANATFVTALRQGEAGELAGSLAGNQIYVCRMFGDTFAPCAARGYSAPGPYPINFFRANPYVNNMTIVDDDGWSNYNALQLQFRQRYSLGMTATVNYTLGKNRGNVWADNATQSGNYFTLRNKTLNDGPAPFDVRHVLQAFATFDIPVGNGRRFAIDNGLLNGLVGGWTLGGIVTAQSGTPFRLTSGRQTVNASDSGVVLMNGHTVEEIQRMINIRPHPTEAFSRYWVDAALLAPDGSVSPEYLAVPTTPGEFGQILYLRGKSTWVFDMSLNKTTTVWGRTQMTVHITMQNVLNQPIWGTAGWTGNPDITSTTFGRTTDPLNGARQIYSRVSFRF